MLYERHSYGIAAKDLVKTIGLIFFALSFLVAYSGPAADGSTAEEAP